MSKLIRVSVLYPFLTAIMLLVGVCAAQLAEPKVTNGEQPAEAIEIVTGEVTDAISEEMP